MKKLYLVAYDINDFNKIAFHRYIASLHNANHISDWWHFLDTSYIVASNLNETQLYNLIYPSMPKRHLLIIGLDPHSAQGWLPKTAWDWINKHK